MNVPSRLPRSFWKQWPTVGFLFVFGVVLQALPPPTPTRTPRSGPLYVRPGRTFNPAAAEAAGGVVVANLQGQVTDESGSPLPGVQYVLTGPNLPGERTGVTDATGRYRISALRPGTYTIRFRFAGFSERLSALSLSPGQIGTVNMVMGAGPPPTPPPPPPTPPPATPPPPPPTVILGPGPTPTRPPDTVDPGDEPIREVYWNSWIERNGEAVSRIEPGPASEPARVYAFDFDLAAFNYKATLGSPGTASAPIDPELRAELQQFRGSEFHFFAKPILGGKALEFVSGQSELRDVEVKMAPLRQPPEGWSRDEPLHLLSPRLRAAQIRIRVKALREGCASMGVSIWNEAMDRPIDHLVREVYVGGDVNDPRCGAGEPGKALRGSLVSLLALPPGQEADAALHIFEMERNDPKSFVVFKKREGPLLTWVMERRLSRFVTEENGLVSRLNAARTAKDYRIVGRPLTDVLFHGSTPDGQRQADTALQLLSDLASRPATPVVFARLVSSEGENLFLPLGLIVIRTDPAVAATERFLGDRVTLTQPLPKNETYSPGAPCIGGWTMVLPDNLGTSAINEFLTPVGPIPGRISRWSDFVSYVGGQPTDVSKGEGLVLLAHQAGEQVWFIQGPDVVLNENIKRRYPRGSVAVLFACGVGDVAGSGSGSPLLTKLNEQGIEAAIVSPFAVQGPVGARFAFHFANEILKARERRENAPLTSLFQRAKTAFQSDDDAAPWKAAVGEFVLAGNGGLELCR